MNKETSGLADFPTNGLLPMTIQFFFPRWGFEKTPWPEFLLSVKKAGYAGIEWFPYGDTTDPQEVISLLQANGLQYAIVMEVYQPPANIVAYLAALETQLEQWCRFGNGQQSPLFISAQTGREYFTEQQTDACIECCRQVSERTRIPIYQETHRNKWSYAAHVVKPVLERHPGLLLTFDVSHWICVSESYLEDQQDALLLAIQRARHIHARVGHTEGPQVWDPAAPEYAQALQTHLAIWDRWIEERKTAGDKYCTITTEFGPPPYMVFGNRTGTPMEEQWRVNLWMKELLEKRYAG